MLGSSSVLIMLIGFLNQKLRSFLKLEYLNNLFYNLYHNFKVNNLYQVNCTKNIFLLFLALQFSLQICFYHFPLTSPFICGHSRIFYIFVI